MKCAFYSHEFKKFSFGFPRLNAKVCVFSDGVASGSVNIKAFGNVAASVAWQESPKYLEIMK